MGSFLRPSQPTQYVGSGTINNGDLLKFGSFVVTAMSADTDYATFCGVAEGQLPIASNIDNASGLDTSMLVRTEGVFEFKTTAGESYTHGIALKMGADAQTVMLDGGASRVIGYAFLPRATAAVVGAAGVTIPVQIKSNFPTGKLG